MNTNSKIVNGNISYYCSNLECVFATSLGFSGGNGFTITELYAYLNKHEAGSRRCPKCRQGVIRMREAKFQWENKSGIAQWNVQRVCGNCNTRWVDLIQTQEVDDKDVHKKIYEEAKCPFCDRKDNITVIDTCKKSNTNTAE